MHKRKTAGRALALLLIALSALISGCNHVSPEQARFYYADGQKLEAQGNLNGAITAYQNAANGDIPEQPQALVDLGRVAMAAKKYDVAVQAYTTLAQKHAFATVNAAPPGKPADNKVVKDWIGTETDHNPNGPLWQAEEKADEQNRGKFAYQVMDRLVALTGKNPAFSYTLAILIFSVVVKLAMTPLTAMQFQSSRKMTAVQPKLKVLQEQYKDKPEEFNKAMWRVYREEGVNPVGCLAGIGLQFPIMIALYQVIRQYNFQFRQAHFLWINPATHALAPGFIGKNLAQPDMILLGLYAVSMFFSQKLMVMPAADEQTKQQQQMMSIMMPVMFLFILRPYPSAFILYWFIFNVLSTYQQWSLLRKYPPAAPAANGNGSAPAPAPKPPDAPAKPGPSRTPPKRKKK